MSKRLRLSEKWFHAGLWFIALLFASFLMGLGSLVVRDLPVVEQSLTPEQFMDQAKLVPIREASAADDAKQNKLNDEQTRASNEDSAAVSAYDNEKQNFDNWIATRGATGQDSQNPEVLKRQRNLDELNQAKRKSQQKLESIKAEQTAVQQHRAKLAEQQNQLEAVGRELCDKAIRKQELQVFGLRLLITLPLLLLAIWLFMKHRKGPRWPFVWGFIMFALYAFFFELVPYMPSYGGYARYLVGIVVTVWGGNYAIAELRRYLETQKAEEQRPEEERRRDLGYEMAQARLTKHVCPACERPLDIADPTANFCTHCGLLVFAACPRCETRQTTFSHFCRSCGLGKSTASEDESHRSLP